MSANNTSKIKPMSLAEFHSSIPNSPIGLPQSIVDSKPVNSPDSKNLDARQLRRFEIIKGLWINAKTLPPKEVKRLEPKKLENNPSETDVLETESSSDQASDIKSQSSDSAKSSPVVSKQLQFSFKAHEFLEFIASGLNLPEYLPANYVISGSIARSIHQESAYIHLKEIQDLDLSLRFKPGTAITLRQSEIISNNLRARVADFIRSKFPAHWTWGTVEDLYQFTDQFCKYSGQSSGSNRYVSVEIEKLNFTIIYDATSSFFTADSILIDCLKKQVISGLPSSIITFDTVLEDARNKKLRVIDHFQKKDILFRLIQMGLLEGYTEFDASVLKGCHQQFLEGHFAQPKSFVRQITNYTEKHFNHKTYGFFKSSLFVLDLYQLLLTQHPHLWADIPESLFDLVLNFLAKSCENQELQLQMDWSLQLRNYFLLAAALKEVTSPPKEPATKEVTQPHTDLVVKEAIQPRKELAVRPSGDSMAVLDFIYGCIYAQKLTRSEFIFDDNFLSIPLDNTNSVNLRRRFPLYVVLLKWINASEVLRNHTSKEVASLADKTLSELFGKIAPNMHKFQLAFLKDALIWDRNNLNFELLALNASRNKAAIPDGFWNETLSDIWNEAVKVNPKKFLSDLPKFIHIAGAFSPETVTDLGLKALKTVEDREKTLPSIGYGIVKELTTSKAPLTTCHYNFLVELLKLIPFDKKTTQLIIELIREDATNPAKRKLVEFFIEHLLYPHHEVVLDPLFAAPHANQLVVLCFNTITDPKRKKDFPNNSKCRDRLQFYLAEDKKSSEDLKIRLNSCADEHLVQLCKIFTETRKTSLSEDLSQVIGSFLYRVSLYLSKNPNEEHSLCFSKACIKWISLSKVDSKFLQSLELILKNYPKTTSVQKAALLKEIQKIISDENITRFGPIILLCSEGKELELFFPSARDLAKKCEIVLLKTPVPKWVAPMADLLVDRLDALNLEELTKLRAAIDLHPTITDKSLLALKAAILKRSWFLSEDDIFRNEVLCELLTLCNLGRLADKTALTAPLYRQRKLTATTRELAWTACVEIYKSEDDKSVYYPFFEKIYTVLSKEGTVTPKSAAEVTAKIHQISSAKERVLLYQFLLGINQKTWKQLIFLPSKTGQELVVNLLKPVPSDPESYYSSPLYRKVIGYLIASMNEHFPIAEFQKTMEKWVAVSSCPPDQLSDLHRYHILQFAKTLNAQQANLVTVSEFHIYFDCALTLAINMLWQNQELTDSIVQLLTFISTTHRSLYIPPEFLLSTKKKMTQLAVLLSQILKIRGVTENPALANQACSNLYPIMLALAGSEETEVVAQNMLAIFRSGDKAMTPIDFEHLAKLWVLITKHAISEKKDSFGVYILTYYYELLCLGNNTPNFWKDPRVSLAHNEIVKAIHDYFIAIQKWTVSDKNAPKIDDHVVQCVVNLTTARGNGTDTVCNKFFECVLATNLMNAIVFSASTCSLKYADVLRNKKQDFESHCLSWLSMQDYLLESLNVKINHKRAELMAKVAEKALILSNYHPNISSFIIQSHIYKSMHQKADVHYCDAIVTCVLPQIDLIPNSMAKIQVITNVLNGSVQLTLTSLEHTSKTTKVEAVEMFVVT